MIYNSAIIMPDALVATILSVILCLFWKTMKEGKFSWRHRVLMGLLTGCIFSVKLTYPCILILPIAAVLLLEERARWVLRSLQIGALMLLGYLATSPFKIADWQHPWPAFLDAVGIMAGYVPPESTGNYYWENLLTHFETMFLKSTKFEYPAGAISTGFGVGVGWAAGLLALMGMFCLLKDHPRCAVPVLLLAACQGVLVLRPWVPYPRYTLFLIPLIAISCGLGLDLMRRILQTCIAKVSTLRPGGPSQGGSSGRQSGLIPAAVCIAFLALSGGRISSTARHAWSVATYRPPQVQAERFLVSTMRPGDKLGIFDFFPWVHDNLRESGIDFERIGVDQSLAELQRRGITHVAGTDRFVSQRMFPPLKVVSLEGSFWPEYLGNSDVKIAEFGSSPIGNRACYPLVDVYLFVVRLPTEASGPVATEFRAQET